MKTRIELTLFYEGYQIELVKIFDFPNYPPPLLSIVDWSTGDELMIHSGSDAPLKLVYVASENLLYIECSRIIVGKEESMFYELSRFFKGQWEINDKFEYDEFVKKYPDFNKFLKSYLHE